MRRDARILQASVGRPSVRRRWISFLSVPLCALLGAEGALGQDSGGSRIGIAHIGAVGAHVGSVAVERSADGVEAGLTADLGWLRGRRLRVQAEIDLLRATLTEFVEVEDSTYHGDIYDLTTSIGAVLLLRGERSRILPYLGVGIGVHALSSAFESLTLDTRYNANPFGVHVAAGMRLRLSSRSAVAFEFRGVTAENVNRTSVRVAGLWFFGDLVRRGRVPARLYRPLERID